MHTPRRRVVEQWLAAAARREAERELDRAIAAYYDQMSPKERAEEARWARFSTQAFMVREAAAEYTSKPAKKGRRG